MLVENREKQSGFHASLLPLLDAAISVDHAAKGNVQIFYPSINALKIVAHRGFNLDFLQLFEIVRMDEPCACGRAFLNKSRIVIDDITTEESFAPFVSIALTNGFRAVQSTPILSSNGSLLGILSTHFASAHRLSKGAKKALDNYACEMVGLIEQQLPAQEQQRTSAQNT